MQNFYDHLMSYVKMLNFNSRMLTGLGNIKYRVAKRSNANKRRKLDKIIRSHANPKQRKKLNKKR